MKVDNHKFLKKAKNSRTKAREFDPISLVIFQAIRFDFDPDLVRNGRFHLARHSTSPYKSVQLQGIVLQDIGYVCCDHSAFVFFLKDES